jgi:hypothetical protein
MFEQLAEWEPQLYVNPHDWICRGYIDYFQQREEVSKKNPRWASTAARTSYRDVLSSMFFSSKSQPHLLPSARLWTSLTPKKEAHGLRQWWMSNRELGLSNRRYTYPLN